MGLVKRITYQHRWRIDEAKIVLTFLAINIGIAIPSIINRGIWVRFVPDEFIGWFMQALAVALYTLLFFHYLMVRVD
jgi:hypothetical protein